MNSLKYHKHFNQVLSGGAYGYDNCDLTDNDRERILRKLELPYRDDVCEYLIDILKEGDEWFNNYYISKLLGIGTVGTVLEICPNTNYNSSYKGYNNNDNLEIGIGNQVMLADNYEDYKYASQGPLDQQDCTIGKVVGDNNSYYQVEVTWWYHKEALTKYRGRGSFRVGDQVKLSYNYKSWGDANSGPLYYENDKPDEGPWFGTITEINWNYDMPILVSVNYGFEKDSLVISNNNNNNNSNYNNNNNNNDNNDNNSSDCFAAKIQFVKEGEESNITRETRLQQVAYNAVDEYAIAPSIESETFFYLPTGQYCYAIVMEVLQRESLDQWLTTKRSKSELSDVFVQIEQILEGIESSGLIHGDLIWFNLGYKYDSDQDSGLDIRLLDFDRADDTLGDSSTYIDGEETMFKEIDILRLLLELHDPSPRQAKINRYNIQYLKQSLLKLAQDKFGGIFEKRNFFRNVTDYWIELYEEYCKRAGVLCLESQGGGTRSMILKKKSKKKNRRISKISKKKWHKYKN